MKNRGVFSGRSAGIFLFISVLSVLFFSCGGGAGGVIDELTADGDYYNDGNLGDNTIFVYGSNTSGTGWVANSSVSSNMAEAQDVLDLNTAINLAKDGVLYSNDTKLNNALDSVNNIVRLNPNYSDAVSIKEVLTRYLELKNNLIPSLEKEISDIESKISQLKKDIEAQQKIVDEKYKTMQEKLAIVDEYDKKLADLKGKIDSGTATDAEKSEYEKLLVQRDLAYKDYENAVKEYQKALDKLNELKSELEYYEVLLTQKKTLLATYEKELEELSTQITKLNSSGYNDYPFTQRWIVRNETNVYDAFQEITTYLKPNQTYKIVGKFGNNYYYEEDEARLTISYGPSGKDSQWSDYYFITGAFFPCDSYDYGNYSMTVHAGVYDSSLSATAYDNTGIGAYSNAYGSFYYGRPDYKGGSTVYYGQGKFLILGEGNDGWSNVNEYGFGTTYTANVYKFEITCNRKSMNQTFECEERFYSLSSAVKTRQSRYWKWDYASWNSYKTVVNQFKERMNKLEIAKGICNWLGNIPKSDVVIYANGNQYIQISDTD